MENDRSESNLQCTWGESYKANEALSGVNIHGETNESNRLMLYEFNS